MKTSMPEMKNTLGGINNRLVITEKKISELEDIAVETPQNETQREKDLKKKKKNRSSVSCQTTSSSCMYVQSPQRGQRH